MNRISLESWALLFQMTMSVEDHVNLLSGLSRMLRHAPPQEVNLAAPFIKKLLFDEGLLHESYNVRLATLYAVLFDVS
jgi:hypothetical protein